MKYNLNRAVRFAWEQEFKSLYQWSLQEFTPDGKAKSGKLVPWQWSLHFIGKEMRHIYNAECQSGPEGQAEHKTRETIQLDLAPGGTWRDLAPTYSMFGTDRRLERFSLSVCSTANDTEAERCHAFGSPSYTTDDEYGRETTEDWIELHLWLRPSNFAALRHGALHGSGEFVVSLRLSCVAGVYAEWTPLVTNDRFKVLASQADQAIVAPTENGPLPSLGTVGEFSLTVMRKSQLALARPEIEPDEDDEEALKPDAPLKNTPEPIAVMQTESAKIQQGLMWLRLPVWLLFLAVAMSLFK
jgi:hypothetical protein